MAVLAALTASTASLLTWIAVNLPPFPALAHGRVVQLMPVPLFELGIRTLGGWAKPSLLLALLLLEASVLTVLGVGWLRLARRRVITTLAALVISTYILFGVIASLILGLGPFASEASGGLRTGLGPLLTYVVWGLGLWGARDATRATRLPLTEKALDDSRRRLVLITMPWLALTVTGLGGGLWALLHRATVPRTAASTGRTPEVTPTRDFYVISKNVLDPTPDPASWRLLVEGMVNRRLELTLDELRALPAVEQWGTMECISNPVGGPLIGNASWKGVRLADLLAHAGVWKGARDVTTVCADGYTESLEMERATHPEVLLVYEMNGEVLTAKHGGPLRLQVPGRYGLKSSKWVELVRVVQGDHRGYWQQESNWTDLGDVHIECRLDQPPERQLQMGATLLTGIAYAGLRGVSRVEVSTDGGETWGEAAVEVPLGPLSWLLWTYDWKPAGPGGYEVIARAYDLEGNPQEEGLSGPRGAMAGRDAPVVQGAMGLHRMFLMVTES